MQKITPCLWFDENAQEALTFYASIFPNLEVKATTRYGEAAAQVSGRPMGSVMTVSFALYGQEFLALNGGPMFAFTPAISFSLNCQSQEEIEINFQKLSDKGQVLMDLAEYPFSKKFGWINDQFGLSWQLNLGNRKQKITPALMFTRDQHGKAEEALSFYISQFPDSTIIKIDRYDAGQFEPEGAVKHALFSIDGQEFFAMDSNREHQFTFTPAISFIVNCQTPEEVDRFWKSLSDGGETGQCGWLKDRYGISWQIVPVTLRDMLKDNDAGKSEQVMKALLQMDKLEIEALQKVYSQ